MYEIIEISFGGVSLVALSGCGQPAETTKELEDPKKASQETSQTDAQKLNPGMVLAVPIAMVPNILSPAGKARDAVRIADLSQLITSVEMYSSDHDSVYPEPENGNCAPGVLSAYFKDDKMLADYGKNTIGGCPNFGYFYCLNKEKGSFSYLVAAKMEKGSEKVNAKEADLLKMCAGEMDVPAFGARSTGTEGFDVYVIAK